MYRAAAQLESLDQVHDHVVPELARLTGASLVFAYVGGAQEQGVRAYLPARTPDLIADYFTEYAGECPLRKVKDVASGRVVATTLLYGYARLAKTRVYNELWRPWGFDHHLALRADDARGGAARDSIGFMINRDRRRGEYTPAELRFFEAVAPTLAGALRRAARFEHQAATVAALEALLVRGAGGADQVVLDADARVLYVHARPEAEPAVRALREPRHPVRAAALRLVRAREDDPPLALEHTVAVGAQRWQASLELRRGPRDGRPLVIVTLTSKAAPSAWAAWGLTRAEEAILRALVEGGSNADIGRALFISPETVRTHLTRIYRKLGVRSRLEAVVAARVRGTA